MATYRKRGDRWQVQVRRKDHPSLTRSFDRKIDADIWVRKTERQLDVGDTSFKDPTILKGIKLKTLLGRYADEITVSKRGCEPEQYRLKTLSNSWLGKQTLDAVNVKLVSKYRDERMLGRSPSTVLKELQLLGHVFQVAQRDWGVPVKVAAVSDVVLPRPSPARTRRLESGELDALLLGCQRGRSTLLAPIIEFAIETGMRRGEIVNARWADLDCDKCTLHIPITKNGSSRTIPMTDKAMQIVQGLAKADERFFPTTGNAIRLAWVRLKKRVGITDLRFHDLRHEAVSRFFEMGLSVPEVALISGHKDPRMLFRYTHLRAEDVGKKLRAKS